MNPHVEPVGRDGTFILITEVGRYQAQVPPETQRVTVIREANTNGVWGFPLEYGFYGGPNKKRLTFIQSGAILAFEFRGDSQS